MPTNVLDRPAVTSNNTDTMQPTSRTGAIQLLKNGAHIDDIDLSKITDRAAKEAVRTQWKEIRKARLEAMTPVTAKAYRAEEHDRYMARRAARNERLGNRPQVANVRVEKAWLLGLAAAIDAAAKRSEGALFMDKEGAAKPAVFSTKQQSGAREDVPLAQYLSRLTVAIQNQITKPRAGATTKDTWLVVKITHADNSRTAYDERFGTEKRAQRKAEKLSNFLQTAGVSGFSFMATTLANARADGVIGLTEGAASE